MTGEGLAAGLPYNRQWGWFWKRNIKIFENIMILEINIEKRKNTLPLFIKDISERKYSELFVFNIRWQILSSNIFGQVNYVDSRELPN